MDHERQTRWSNNVRDYGWLTGATHYDHIPMDNARLRDEMYAEVVQTMHEDADARSWSDGDPSAPGDWWKKDDQMLTQDLASSYDDGQMPDWALDRFKQHRIDQEIGRRGEWDQFHEAEAQGRADSELLRQPGHEGDDWVQKQEAERLAFIQKFEQDRQEAFQKETFETQERFRQEEIQKEMSRSAELAKAEYDKQQELAKEADERNRERQEAIRQQKISEALDAQQQDSQQEGQEPDKETRDHQQEQDEKAYRAGGPYWDPSRGPADPMTNILMSDPAKIAQYEDYKALKREQMEERQGQEQTDESGQQAEKSDPQSKTEKDQPAKSRWREERSSPGREGSDEQQARQSRWREDREDPGRSR